MVTRTLGNSNPGVTSNQKPRNHAGYEVFLISESVPCHCSKSRGARRFRIHTLVTRKSLFKYTSFSQSSKAAYHNSPRPKFFLPPRHISSLATHHLIIAMSFLCTAAADPVLRKYGLFHVSENRDNARNPCKIKAFPCCPYYISLTCPERCRRWRRAGRGR